MNREKEITQNLGEIPWLSKCGDPMNIEITMDIVRASSWEEVRKSLASSQWQRATLEANNDLHEEAQRRKKGPWNLAVKGYRPIIEAAVQEKLLGVAESLELGDLLLNSVRWNLLGWAMEVHFLEKQRGFFGEIYRLYRAGHLPCGWEGKWPRGKLIVF